MALIELRGIERGFQLGDSVVHALTSLDLAIAPGDELPRRAHHAGIHVQIPGRDLAGGNAHRRT